MKQTETIFVSGHRNPDTDSIVSAMAYAALQNALGHREYRPARLGQINDETQRLLDYFGFPPPELITTMRSQVRDLDYDTPPVISDAVSVGRAWAMLQQDGHVPAVPVTQEDGSLFGMLTAGDIANHNMQSIDNPLVESLPLFNLLGALEGQLIQDGGDDTISGEVVIALQADCPSIHPGCIVVCGNHQDVLERCLEVGASCIIVCRNLWNGEIELPKDCGTCIISTPFDAYRTVRTIHQAIPVSRLCRQEGIITFHLNDFTDDVKDEVLKSRHRCYPILDGEEKVVGTLSRFHLLRPRRKQVVLVDHNESAQSVPGLDQAEILGIIDHHRLADIQTANPIFFRNEPVGSTTTIIAEMYQEKGIMPSGKLAGLMTAAILSDTVMFKSPTSTPRDQDMAKRLARIGNVSLEELGQRIFAYSTAGTKSARELLMSDFKEFHIAGNDLGIGQVTCVESAQLLERKDEFLKAMDALRKERHYSLVALMLTDVLLEGTQLIALGDDEALNQALNTELKDHTVFLPGIMSRKKQIIPMLSALWG